MADLQESLQRQNLSLAGFGNSKDPALQSAAHGIELIIERAGRTAAAMVDTPEVSQAGMAAVRLLAWSTNQIDLETLVSIATRRTGPLQKAALSSLKARRDPTLPPLIVAAWPQASPTCREQILDILLSRDDSVRQLLDAVENNIIVATEIPIANRQQLQRSSDPTIQQRALALFPAHSGNRAEVVTRFSAVKRLVGNPEHGAQVFSTACATCHQLKGLGSAVGPDLAPLNDKSVDDFLVAILDPNAAIEPRFVQYNIQTRDGRTLAGVIQNETASSLTLVQSGGVRDTILRSDIASIRASTLSLMPEGLEEGKQPQDLADLIAYVKSQPSPFGTASAEKAEAARKRLVADPAFTKPSIKSAAESLPYPSWLGTLPLQHCRMTDGRSSLAWTCAAPKTFKPHSMNLFRIPVGMGFLSESSGKFFLKVNGHSAVDFDVSLRDAIWKNPASEVILQYQVMENNEQDSNGLLTVSIRGEWLQPGQPVAFEVTGSASNSQRWFGIYSLEADTQASAVAR
jgi:putative heme-binding domain-containing protein